MTAAASASSPVDEAAGSGAFSAATTDAGPLSVALSEAEGDAGVAGEAS